MTGPTDEQRAAYVAASERLAQAEDRIKPQVDGLAQQIALLQAPEVLPARKALEEVTDEIGEPYTSCCGCGVLLWDEDDCSSDEDGEVHACPKCVERWGGAGWAERDDVNECAAAFDAKAARDRQ